jgi:hypothetical protein
MDLVGDGAQSKVREQQGEQHDAPAADENMRPVYVDLATKLATRVSTTTITEGESRPKQYWYV